MKKICVIGARSGSKGIKDKNLLELKGKSLLQIAVIKLQSMAYFDMIIVSTDSESYGATLKGLMNSRTIVKLRPESIAKDASTEIEYLRHAVQDVVEENDIVCRYQVTSPFQQRQSVFRAAEFLRKNIDSIDSTQIVTESYNPVYKSLRIGDNNQLHAYMNGEDYHPSNRQKREKSYYRSNFYCFKASHLFESRWLGDMSVGILGEEIESVEIDVRFDYFLAKSIVNSSWHLLDLP